MSELTDTLTEMDSGPLTIMESADIPSEKLEQMRQAFSLHISGQTYDAIAAAMGISRATVARLLAAYREDFRKKLETEPTLHLIAERLNRYETLTNQALADADKATTAAERIGHRRSAYHFLRAFDELALACGILPKEPDRLFTIIADGRPDSMRDDRDKPTRTVEEQRATIDELVKHGRLL